MFNSTIIDAAIGMVLSFLAVSLAASTEAISSVLQLSQTLANGVQALLNYHPQDHPLALNLCKSSLISPLTSGTATSFDDIKHKPAYIDSRQFALAFYNALEKKTPQAAVGQIPSTDDVIRMISDPQLKNAMEALWDISAKDVDAFKHNIAVWFDNSMDRLSGGYKRWTQWVSFVVALLIAVVFNVNALYESAQIWTRPSIIADMATSHFQDDLLALNDGKNQTAEGVQRAYNALEPAFIIGWVKGPEPHDWQSLYIAVASWFLVADATLFGASFWFDMLQNLTRLRGTGLEPKRSAKPPQPGA